MAKIVRAVVGIIYDDDQFLLLKKQGLWVGWQFVQGKIDAGEDEMQALHREIAEETGLVDVHMTKNLEVRRDYWCTIDGECIHKFLTYFLVRGDKRQPVALSEEHSDAQWCGYEEVLRALAYDKDVFELAYQHVQNE